MEGPLSKWTNVIEGWQYRWFVLDEVAGTLSYYVSKQKMNRGQPRGCVRLKGAIIAIQDEDDSSFTVSTDQKTFHFQGRDADERERWVRALELVIHKHSGYYKPRTKRLTTFANQSTLSTSQGHPATIAQGIKHFEHQLALADQYLQLLIDQTKELESKASESVQLQQEYAPVIESANALLDTVKHAIIMMQMTKNQIYPTSMITSASNLTAIPPVTALLGPQSSENSANEDKLNESASSTKSLKLNDTPLLDTNQPLLLSPTAGALQRTPPVSYSSSEDEYEDAHEHMMHNMSIDDSVSAVVHPSQLIHDNALNVETVDGLMGANQLPPYETTPGNAGPNDKAQGRSTSIDHPNAALTQMVNADLEPAPEFEHKNVDFDAVCEDDTETELGNVQEHGSVIMHLLSQVSIGMDLTKIPLPTFILERRSLLEMYADFFAHPDLFLRITDEPTAEARFVATVKWYMSSFHAGRRCSVAKKPYNPIIGENFHCYWQVPADTVGESGTPNATQTAANIQLSDGQSPFEGAGPELLTFVAEQVSHHPPISAFYAENIAKRMQCSAHIWTKSKFLGLSIGVHMVGQGCVTLLDHGEHYVASFPSGYGRSILTVPWVELGGKVTVACEQTGYHANIQFHTKPFYGGKTHLISGELFRPNNSKTPFMTIRGEWNGRMTYKMEGKKDEQVFLDVRCLEISKKMCRPISDMHDLWKHVTVALQQNEIHGASAGKQWLEHRQRLEHKYRDKLALKWKAKYFHEDGEGWTYNWPLINRMQSSNQQKDS